ncbi:MAG: Na+/H+ antiporter NhaC family protein [Victivallales bacterium]|nr:Na+/H+ antiporter NhaC family protein [Victivallales bacterium]MCF7888636.1 Na+/H+ antiporter NhaC family protein [Victivallales bacterium]
MENIKQKKSFLALTPFIVFLGIYLGVSIVLNDFYKVPIVVAATIAAIVALLMNSKEKINDKIEVFTRGSGNSTIMLMCLIFILAGIFSAIAKETGAVSSTVNMALTYLPAKILLPGLFIVACFISLAIGTSTGTVAALGPIAVGFSNSTGMPVALVLGTVLSGAMFGDSLSFISDTTIAATKTQECRMDDKFKMNFLIVFPAAVISFIIYFFVSKDIPITALNHVGSFDFIKVVPYIVVIVISVLGVNVFYVLLLGIILSTGFGFLSGSFNIWQLFNTAQNGINSMVPIILIATILGGIVEIIKYNGGIEAIMSFMKKRMHSRRGAEFGIGILVSLVNICTANNTVAIIMTGPLAKNIADKYGIEGKRSASLLDIFSCFVQGIIPYGAQLLLAVSFVGISKLSPVSVMQYLYYPYLTGVCVIIAIIFNIPKSINLKFVFVIYKFLYRFVKHTGINRINYKKNNR